MFLLLSLSGCNVQTYKQQAEAREAQVQEQSQALIGQPVTAFIDATSLAPVSEIKTKAGKTFFFEKSATSYVPPVSGGGGGYYNNAQIAQAVSQFNASMATPGHYVTSTCKSVVKTKKTGHSGGMEDYIITEIALSGPCS